MAEGRAGTPTGIVGVESKVVHLLALRCAGREANPLRILAEVGERNGHVTFDRFQIEILRIAVEQCRQQ